jgi:hypothetical protein
MSSGTSTDRDARQGGAGFEVWHLYLMLSLGGAITVVMVSQSTHPAALLLLSAAVLATGLVATMIHHGLAALLGARTVEPRLTERSREGLERDKALVLRSIKELEFDRAMRKVGDADFAEISASLRARAMSIMQDLEGTLSDDGPVTTATAEPAPDVVATERGVCAACAGANDSDARFCKHCGARLGEEA